MSLDRRGFLAAGGGALVCTLAGQKVREDREADLERLALDVPEPDAVRTGARAAQATVSGPRREYWLVAEPVRWTIVPNKRDEMMDAAVKGRTTFGAYAYVAYSKDFGRPLGKATIPGPTLEAEVGETLVVHFRNRTKVPLTVHPHGVFYTPDMDGAYKGRFSDPGGFVKPGATFTYVWECREGTEGVWPYHDHGPMDPLPVYKGLFGFLNVRKPGAPRPDVEHYIAFHAFLPVATGLKTAYQCINGRSFTGNTPTLTAKVGQRVAQHITVMSDDFHTYHLHGHRWRGPDGRVVDNVTLGPADAYSLEFVEDNPGRWFYHCHVFSHLHEGMSGWYVVDP
ncbi:multicopper oxidase domain-containing protein [Conexibacter sp. SYSU D00693]|uniref:multicopper oxidase domain-containing protein n=1 Tax=Conexibacter sp. SYSU D00693 TaxID=2812560 RepID=UPI00196B8FC7|nr:multicopper oxidase domain-containing protein [Conexibacter sp. SYSU D00693]